MGNTLRRKCILIQIFSMYLMLWKPKVWNYFDFSCLFTTLSQLQNLGILYTCVTFPLIVLLYGLITQSSSQGSFSVEKFFCILHNWSNYCLYKILHNDTCKRCTFIIFWDWDIGSQRLGLKYWQRRTYIHIVGFTTTKFSPLRICI